MFASDQAAVRPLDPALAAVLRQTLLRLAALEDAQAADEASRVAYWEPCPASVLGHRAAARALRADADRYLPVLPDRPAA